MACCRAASKRELQTRDGFLLVVLVWTSLPAFATLPLLIYMPDLSFHRCLFRNGVGHHHDGCHDAVRAGHAAACRSICGAACWYWLGGMGLIVLAVAILPLLGVGGMQIYKAETPGPMKDTKLTPRITETAKGLYLIYVGISIACWHLVLAGRHDAVRCRHAYLFHDGAGRLFLA